MKKALLFVVSVFMVGLLMSCVDFEIDAIGRIELQNVTFPETFVVDEEPTLDLSGGSIRVYDRSTPENLIDTIPLNDEAVFWGGTGFVSFVNSVLTLKTEAAQPYFVRVSYGGVSIRLNYTVTGVSGPSEWDGTYPSEAPATFELTENDTTKTVTLRDAAAFAWFAETLNNTDHLREDGYLGFTVTLTNDLDLGGNTWTPIGVQSPFKGSFDGGDYTISNLLLSSDPVDVSTYYSLEEEVLGEVTFSMAFESIKSGLFYSLGSYNGPVTIENLTIELSSTPQTLRFQTENAPPYGNPIGILAQTALNSTIRNIHVIGTTVVIDLDGGRGAFFGGIIGEVQDYYDMDVVSVVIDDCEVTDFSIAIINNTSYAYIGGIIGQAMNNWGTLTVTISNTEVSVFTATVASSGAGSSFIHGLANSLDPITQEDNDFPVFP